MLCTTNLPSTPPPLFTVEHHQCSTQPPSPPSTSTTCPTSFIMLLPPSVCARAGGHNSHSRLSPSPPLFFYPLPSLLSHQMADQQQQVAEDEPASPLMREELVGAFEKGYSPTAVRLLDGGEDIVCGNGGGAIPLMSALLKGDFEAAKILFVRGAASYPDYL